MSTSCHHVNPYHKSSADSFFIHIAKNQELQDGLQRMVNDPNQDPVFREIAKEIGAESKRVQKRSEMSILMIPVLFMVFVVVAVVYLTIGKAYNIT